MDKKQQFKIPKFVIAIAIILVVALLFLIFVFMRFTGTLEGYEKNHASATAEINKYQDYLNRSTEVQASINQMKAQYEKESAALTVNPRSTLDDIRKMLSTLGYDLSSLSVGEPAADPAGRQSATGDPLYTTTISYAFNTTEAKMLETLRYFESESDGSYFISKLTLTRGDDAESAKSYSASMDITLYYFNSDENMGLPVSALESSEASE